MSFGLQRVLGRAAARIPIFRNTNSDDESFFSNQQIIFRSDSETPMGSRGGQMRRLDLPGGIVR
jgi:hypothetical protein